MYSTLEPDDRITITPENKQSLIAEYATVPGDTGSPEVQVAVLSKRIDNLKNKVKAMFRRVSAVFPGGSQGVVGSRGQHLGAPFTASFTVAPGSTLRLQQMLAELGYLPVSFTAASPRPQTFPARPSPALYS